MRKVVEMPSQTQRRKVRRNSLAAGITSVFMYPPGTECLWISMTSSGRSQDTESWISMSLRLCLVSCFLHTAQSPVDFVGDFSVGRGRQFVQSTAAW